MNNEIKVTGINIKVKGKELTLTVDEARELKRELDTLLEVKWHQPWCPPYPYVIQQYPTPPYCYGEIASGGLVGGIAQMERLSK